jgi:hypothetical protein
MQRKGRKRGKKEGRTRMNGGQKTKNTKRKERKHKERKREIRKEGKIERTFHTSLVLSEQRYAV